MSNSGRKSQEQSFAKVFKALAFAAFRALDRVVFPAFNITITAALAVLLCVAILNAAFHAFVVAAAFLEPGTALYRVEAEVKRASLAGATLLIVMVLLFSIASQRVYRILRNPTQYIAEVVVREYASSASRRVPMTQSNQIDWLGYLNSLKWMYFSKMLREATQNAVVYDGKEVRREYIVEYWTSGPPAGGRDSLVAVDARYFAGCVASISTDVQIAADRLIRIRPFTAAGLLVFYFLCLQIAGTVAIQHVLWHENLRSVDLHQAALISIDSILKGALIHAFESFDISLVPHGLNVFSLHVVEFCLRILSSFLIVGYALTSFRLLLIQKKLRGKFAKREETDEYKFCCMRVRSKMIEELMRYSKFDPRYISASSKAVAQKYSAEVGRWLFTFEKKTGAEKARRLCDSKGALQSSDAE